MILKYIKRVCVFLLVVSFFTSTLPVYASSWTPQLPALGQILSPTPAFDPIDLIGIEHDPKHPFEFQFLVNPGEKYLPPKGIGRSD